MPKVVTRTARRDTRAPDRYGSGNRARRCHQRGQQYNKKTQPRGHYLNHRPTVRCAALAQRLPRIRLIVLGDSIGGIRLDERRRSVEKVVGRGTSERRGLVSYFEGRLVVDYWFHDGLTGRLEGLETRWGGFHTRSGVRVGSSQQELSALHVSCSGGKGARWAGDRFHDARWQGRPDRRVIQLSGRPPERCRSGSLANSMSRLRGSWPDPHAAPFRSSNTPHSDHACLISCQAENGSGHTAPIGDPEGKGARAPRGRGEW